MLPGLSPPRSSPARSVTETVARARGQRSGWSIDYAGFRTVASRAGAAAAPWSPQRHPQAPWLARGGLSRLPGPPAWAACLGRLPGPDPSYPSATTRSVCDIV